MHINTTISCSVGCAEPCRKIKTRGRRAHSVGGRLQRLDSDCDDERVSGRRRTQRRNNNNDYLGDFWLFPSVWEDGRDNCYLGGEQRKQLHQEKAGHPQAAGTRSSRTHMWTRTRYKHASLLCSTQSPAQVSFSLCLSCFLSKKNTSVAFSPQNDKKEKKSCLVISPLVSH